MSWVAETWRTYADNSTSVRDFRVQMRGAKTVLAWTLYLLVLLTVGYFTYSTIQGMGMGSPAMIQRQLGSFFDTMFRMIAGAIAVIAPGLTAASVVGERQRQSFDLVFSAPVTPKFYLVGKMLSSYRYTLMLLVLSLPVLALSAMLGGATWADILICYFMLSMFGLIATSISLLVSAVVQKVQPAVALSYLLVGVYLALTASFAGPLLFGGFLGVPGPIGEMPFFVTLNPFLLPESYGTYTLINEVRVPNWIFNAVFTLAIVRFALLGAGSALSSFGSPETKSLRIQSLAYLLAGCALLQFLPGPMTPYLAGGSIVTFAFWVALMSVPWIAAWGRSERTISVHDGPWNWRKALVGTPSGAGPYLSAMLAVIVVGGWYVCRARSIPLESALAHFVEGAGVLVFLAGLTRAACALLGYARGKSLSNTLTVLSLWILPIIVSFPASASVRWGVPFEKNPIWFFWPMWPLFTNFSYTHLYAYGICAAAIGAVMWLGAERSAQRMKQA